MCVQLFKAGPLNVVHIREDIAPQKFLLQSFDGGAFSEGVGNPYHVGDEVQDEWAEGDVGHIFVLAVIKAPAPGTHIDGRTPAIGTLPIYRRGHAAATASAPEKTGKDVRVLPLIGQTVGV